MYFINAISYPFSGERSITVAAVFGVLLVIPVLNILGAIMMLGYATRLVPEIYRGVNDKPEFDFGGDFGRGILLLVALIAYNIIPIVIAIPLFLIAGDNSALIIIGAILISLLALITNLGFVTAFLRYSLERKTDVIFDVMGNYSRPFSRFDATLLYIVNYILFAIITGIATQIGFVLLICPGILLAGAFQLSGTFYLNTRFGQAMGIQPSQPLRDPNADDFTGDFGGGGGFSY